ncbi:hypothetical protein GNI_072140 [Gregarina niphandrodes]|uniref:Uncharacterized protein n=1 Tax=Gregarina niphandrodes TaxID=110365 RepID=A0A023B766_GRENI|nr:hypothetical protein GNI_072140 [Gregarina niphandrodes]EZG67070.1 hypothetical protein GNI_072140 [Gregarina niphandrodes]|eukprot:XP_011130347.1 hypothetical protein GNI_072140 [Gregarina niphandrodes]
MPGRTLEAAGKRVKNEAAALRRDYAWRCSESRYEELRTLNEDIYAIMDKEERDETVRNNIDNQVCNNGAGEPTDTSEPMDTTPAPEALGSTAPEALGSTAPEALGSTAPEALGSTAPEALGSTAPEALGSTAPEALGSTAPGPAARRTGGCYSPSVPVLTGFGYSAKVFRCSRKGYVALHGLLSSPQWRQMGTLEWANLKEANLRYVELAAVISMYFDNPFGYATAGVREYVGALLKEEPYRCLSWRGNAWVQGCFLERAGVSLEKLQSFCVEHLGYVPVMKWLSFECMRPNPLSFHRYSTRLTKSEGEVSRDCAAKHLAALIESLPADRITASAFAAMTNGNHHPYVFEDSGGPVEGPLDMRTHMLPLRRVFRAEQIEDSIYAVIDQVEADLLRAPGFFTFESVTPQRLQLVHERLDAIRCDPVHTLDVTPMYDMATLPGRSQQHGRHAYWRLTSHLLQAMSFTSSELANFMLDRWTWAQIEHALTPRFKQLPLLPLQAHCSARCREDQQLILERALETANLPPEGRYFGPLTVTEQTDFSLRMSVG